MKRFAMICCFVLLTASLAFAQAQPAPKPETKPESKPAAAALPTIDQVLDKYVQGMGGKEALQKHNSRVSKGTFEIPAMGANGTFLSYEKAPNLTASTIEIPGFGAVNIVFDGKSGWQKDPMQGLREQTGAELALVKIQSEFYGPLKMKDLYKKIEVKSKDKVGSAEVYVVEATPPEGSVVKLSFDTTTGLLVRQEAETDTPQGKMPTETLIEDYRVVDGVKLPFVVKTNTPAFGFVVKLEEIKHNVPIEDAKFVKPSAQ
jgi:hypothetical protein